ncbi:MAG: N-acetyltransferase [Defluviitaleaceae bacterium]|nr:N-acetyltransferase [Defluviitaleaceae bacterium]
MSDTKNKLHIRLERPEDHFAVESITREAHWDGHWDMEPTIDDTHLLVHKLRQSPSYVPELHYVAELDGKLVGHILYTIGKIVDDSNTAHEVLTFGPLSVLPDYQHMGIGKALMHFTFEKARQMSHHGILIFGHPDYYPRIGFRRAAEFGITTSDGTNFDPFMAFPLYDNAFDGISGRFYIDPIFDNLTQEEALAFDKQFPPKEIGTPISMRILLDRLAPPAQKALDDLKDRALFIMQTKSERELSSLAGIDTHAIETIRTVMREHGRRWGTQ